MMNRFKRVAYVPLLVFVFNSDSAAQTAANADSVVALRFGWPAGMKAVVNATRFRARASAGKADTTAFEFRYSMEVSPHAEGRLIRSGGFTFGDADNAADAEVVGVTEQLSALLPAIIVSPQGAFVRTDNIGALKAKMDSMIAPVRNDKHSPELRTLLANLTAESTLNAIAAQTWNAGVGIWVGAEFELGAVYESEEPAAIPFFPGETLPMVTQFEIVGRVPCIEESGRTDCVELHLVSSPDEAALKALLKKMMDMAVDMPAGSPPIFDEIKIQTEITLIAEPSTLIPHWYSQTKSTGGSFRVGNEPGSFSQVEEQTAAYTYVKR
jgi:hypothetical protein